MGGRYLDPEQSQEKRQARMDFAMRQYVDAKKLAAEHGLRLLQRTPVHYQLGPMDGSWLLNVYPSNRRLYHDRSKPRLAPFLKVRDAWTLMDVVQAASEQWTGKEKDDTSEAVPGKGSQGDR